ncbi:MAG: hypothetical protein V1826_01095, partial [bacterium]
HLSLTMANQYMAQLSDTIKGAILGNVGTIISFRVGGDDAGVLVKEFAPVFDEQDLVNLDIFKIYLKLSVDGLTANSFSATTLPPSAEKTNSRDKIIALSRERYAKDIAFVEQRIAETGVSPASTMNRVPDDRDRKRWGGDRGGDRDRGGSRPQPPASLMVDTGDRSRDFRGRPQPQRPPVNKPAAKDMLSDLISRVEKQKKTTFTPDEKDTMAKTLMNDLKDESGSIKEALERAHQRQEEDQKQAGNLKPNETIKLDQDDQDSGPATP